MKLIVALGNPGSQYEQTRHNSGFLALDSFLEFNDLGSATREDKFNSVTVSGSIEGEHCIFAYPQTFMNESGQAVSEIMRFYKLTPDNLIVLHDEIDLPLGTI